MLQFKYLDAFSLKNVPKDVQRIVSYDDPLSSIESCLSKNHTRKRGVRGIPLFKPRHALMPMLLDCRLRNGWDIPRPLLATAVVPMFFKPELTLVLKLVELLPPYKLKPGHYFKKSTDPDLRSALTAV